MKLSINPKLVAAVATFRTIGDIRYYLNGIYVEPLQGGGVVLVATNGHALCAWRDANGEAERSAVLHVTPGLLTACKAREAKRLLIADDRLAVHTAKGVETFIQRRRVGSNGWEIEGKFPDWRRVIPIADKPGVVNSMAPQYLSLVTNALKIGTTGNSRYMPSISMWQPEAGRGIGITSVEAPDFFAVVMPIHESIAPPPKWLTALAKTQTTAGLPLPGQQPSDAAPLAKGSYIV